jgi:iron complex transport system ATP-binding protein
MKWLDSLLGRGTAGVGPRRSGGAVLEAQDLCFAYGGRTALDGASLRVGPGEIVGLIGPNGSGKSTILKILSRVLAGYQGRVLLDGRDLRELDRREVARDLAVVPQEAAFSLPFTVLEVVLLGRHPHMGRLAFEAADDVAQARQALAHCGALHLAERSIHELSSGERQRVVFARALAQEPRVLLLDEPASFLDIRHQIEIYELVRSLAEKSAASILLVVHDLNLAAEYCDRVYLMRRGRVDTSGPTAAVFTYANLSRVFETDLYVDQNSITGKLMVVPLSGRAKAVLAGRAGPAAPHGPSSAARSNE